MVYDKSKLACFLAHRASLVDYAARIVGSRAWAEDIVQEAFLRFAAVDEWNSAPIARPCSYLRRIVRNLALDWASHLYPDGRPALDEDASADHPSTWVDTISPEYNAIRHEALDLIETALTELPQRTRKAFELHLVEDRTLNEIRQELGISTTLAFELVRRARLHCAVRLAQP